jgi:SAM-dependent methyltransferase
MSVKTTMCRACRSPEVEFGFESHDKDFSKAGFRYLKCRHCGSHSLDPVPTETELSALYERGEFTLAQKVDASHYLNPDRFKRDRELYVSHLADRFSKAQALDFGCGSGWLVHHLSDIGFDATGIDADPASIEMAKSSAFSGSFRVGATLSEIRSNSLDIFCAMTLLEHVADPDQFISEVTRTLRSGGVLQISVPLADSLQMEMLGPHFYWAMAPFHTTLFTRPGVTSLMARHGLALSVCKPIPNSWYWTRAIADKLGRSTDYHRWRNDKSFVDFDIQIDALFDRVAIAMNKPSAALLVFERSN